MTSYEDDFLPDPDPPASGDEETLDRQAEASEEPEYRQMLNAPTPECLAVIEAAHLNAMHTTALADSRGVDANGEIARLLARAKERAGL